MLIYMKVKGCKTTTKNNDHVKENAVVLRCIYKCVQLIAACHEI